MTETYLITKQHKAAINPNSYHATKSTNRNYIEPLWAESNFTNFHSRTK